MSTREKALQKVESGMLSMIVAGKFPDYMCQANLLLRPTHWILLCYSKSLCHSLTLEWLWLGDDLPPIEKERHVSNVDVAK